MTIRVLIIDDQPQRSQRLEQALGAAGFEVLAVTDGEQRLHEQLTRLTPEAVIVDTELPARDTLEHFAALGEGYPQPMIMLDAQLPPALTLQAGEAGMTAYALAKLDGDGLRELIGVAIAHFRAHARQRQELLRGQRPRADAAPRPVLHDAEETSHERWLQ